MVKFQNYNAPRNLALIAEFLMHKFFLPDRSFAAFQLWTNRAVSLSPANNNFFLTIKSINKKTFFKRGGQENTITETLG